MVTNEFVYILTILKRGVPCYYFPGFEEIEKFLLENSKDGDLILTMGCGNIDLVADALVQSDLAKK